MRIIGLTGGSGSGKSYIAAMLLEQGFYVIDADKIAKNVLEKNTAPYYEAVEYFGGEILNTDKTINRKSLANIIFTNPKKRLKLEQITHKHIKEEIRRQIKCIANEPGSYKYIVIDAALLIQSGMHKETDEVWLVHAPFKTRVARICRRDGITEEQAVLRLRAQTPFYRLKKHAHVIIEN